MAEPLARNGHNITLLLAQHFLDLSFIPSPPNITEYRILSSAGPEALRLGAEAYQVMSFSPSSALSFLVSTHLSLVSQTAHCEALFHTDGNPIVERLKNTHFDVALTNMFDSCPFFLFHTLGIESVAWHSAISSPMNIIAASTGIPISPSYIPEPLIGLSSDSMDFFERLTNLGKDTKEGIWMECLHKFVSPPGSVLKMSILFHENIVICHCEPELCDLSHHLPQC